MPKKPQKTINITFSLKKNRLKFHFCKNKVIF